MAHVTRLGGDSAAAQPFIDKFLRYLEDKLGWPTGESQGRFHPTRKEALAFIDTEKPGFGLLEPAVYFELRKPKRLEAVAQIESKELVTGRLHLVVKDAALKSPSDLGGKSLCSTLADQPRYLSRIVFEGKLDAASHFSLQPVRQAIKGVRNVLKGECSATLLDDDMLVAAAKLEGGAELRAISVSPPLPPAVLVAFGKTTAVEKKKLVTQLTSMCADPVGQAICQEMRIARFVPVDQKLFADAAKSYESYEKR